MATGHQSLRLILSTTGAEHISHTEVFPATVRFSSPGAVHIYCCWPCRLIFPSGNNQLLIGTIRTVLSSTAAGHNSVAPVVVVHEVRREFCSFSLGQCNEFEQTAACWEAES